MSVPKRDLIGVDESELRRGICSFLEPEIAVDVCGEAVNGGDAVEKAKEFNPDMIVLDDLDDSTPRMDDMDAGTDWKAMLAETHVILFTGDYPLGIQTAATSTGLGAVVPQPEIGGLVRRLEFLLDRNVRKRSSPGP